MNPKIEKLEKDIEKATAKIAELQKKVRDMQAQKTELENLQIVQLVRSMRLSPAELTALLSGGGIPGMAAYEETTEQEDTDHEE